MRIQWTWLPLQPTAEGTEWTERPLEFSSHSFNNTEIRYWHLEKGLLSLVRAVKQAEQIRREQNVTFGEHFWLLGVVLKGTSPHAGIAQKPTVCKWYAYLEGINEIMPVTEGRIKVSKLQKDIDCTPLFQPAPSPPWFKRYPHWKRTVTSRDYGLLKHHFTDKTMNAIIKHWGWWQGKG